MICALRVSPRARSNQNGAPRPISTPANTTDTNQIAPAPEKMRSATGVKSFIDVSLVTAEHLRSAGVAGLAFTSAGGVATFASSRLLRPVSPSTPMQNGQASTVIDRPVSRSSVTLSCAVAMLSWKALRSPSLITF